MVDIQTISIAIASSGVFIAAVYYIWQFRHQTKLRQTDLVVRLFSIYMTDEFRDALARVWNLQFKDYEEYEKKYGFMWSSEGPVPKAVSKVDIFFNGVGVLVKRKLIDIELVDQMISVSRTWEKVKPIIEGIRKHYSVSTYYEPFESLYNEIKKREQPQ